MTCSVAVFISSVLPLTDPSAELTSEMPPYTLPSSDTPSADRLVSFSVIVFDTASDALLTKSIAVPPVAFSVAVFTVSMLPLTDPSEDLTSVMPPYTQPPSDTPSADRAVLFSVIVFDAAPAAPLTKTAEAPPVRVTEEFWVLPLFIVTVLLFEAPCRESVNVSELKIGSCPSGTDWAEPLADSSVPVKSKILLSAPSLLLTNVMEPPPAAPADAYAEEPV